MITASGVALFELVTAGHGPKVGEALQRGLAHTEDSGSTPDMKAEVAPNALTQRQFPNFGSALFGSPLPVRSAAQVNAAPRNVLPVTPLPVPPLPQPYVFFGQYRDAEGTRVFYLRRDKDIVVAKDGDKLDNEFRLALDGPQSLSITYLPTGHTYSIPVESPAP